MVSAREYRDEARVWRNLADSFATFQRLADPSFGYYPSREDARRSVGLCYTVERLADDDVWDDLAKTLRKNNGVRRQAIADLVEARFNQHCEAHETCRAEFVFERNPEGDNARALFCLLMEQEALDDAAAVL